MKKILFYASILLPIFLFASCSTKTNLNNSKPVNTIIEKAEIPKQVQTENCYPNTNVPDYGKFEFADPLPLYEYGKEPSDIGYSYHYYKEGNGAVLRKDFNKYLDILTNEYNFSYVEKSGNGSNYSDYSVTFTNSKEYVVVSKLADYYGLLITIYTPEDLIKLKTRDDYKYKLY